MAIIQSIKIEYESQGQDFENLGLYICKPLFSHGQLYVALSRGKNPKNIFIQNDLEVSLAIEYKVWNEVFY